MISMSETRNDENPDHVPSIRRGLVIAGGGAKGAYAFGCLKAFRDAGLYFEAVSGTSSGALNAYIWSTKKISEGEKLWLNMSPDTAYKSNRFLSPMPRLLRKVLGFLFVLYCLSFNRFRGVRTPGSGNIIINISVVIFISTIYVISSIPFAFINPSVVTGLLLFTLPLTAIAQIFALRSNNTEKEHIPLLLISIMYFLILTLSFVFLLIPRPKETMNLIDFCFMLIISASSSIFCIVYCLVIYFSAHWLAQKTTMSPAPLRATIDSLGIDLSCGIPTYATVACEAALFDPDAPDWISETAILTGRDPSMEGPWSPDLRKHWLPEYLRIDQMHHDARIATLLASAALPFGIVSSVKMRGKEFVDGGVADNFPIAPLLNNMLDEIYLIVLGNTPHEWETTHRIFSAKTMLRLIEISKLAPPPSEMKPHRTLDTKAKYPPTIVPFPEFVRIPKIFAFHPNKNLGGIFDGLLNFSSAYSKKIMEMGYNDSKERLRQLGVSPVDDRRD